MQLHVGTALARATAVSIEPSLTHVVDTPPLLDDEDCRVFDIADDIARKKSTCRNDGAHVLPLYN
jgi:hypothetical protein